MILRIPGILILLTALSGAVSVAVAAMPVIARYSAADQAQTAAAQSAATQTAATQTAATQTGASQTELLAAQSTPRVDLSPIFDFAPFGRAAAAQTDTPVATEANLTLQGMSVSPNPAASRAIIAGGIGDSTSYATGQVVSPGLTLTEIAADHVILTSDTGIQRLDFPNAAAPTEGDETDAPGFSTALQNLIPQTSPTAPTMSSLRADLNLNPEGLLSRYDVTATADGYVIGPDTPVTGTGLQPGDIITLINGLPVGDVTTDSAFLDEVAASGQATVVVDRSGQTVTLQVILP